MDGGLILSAVSTLGVILLAAERIGERIKTRELKPSEGAVDLIESCKELHDGKMASIQSEINLHRTRWHEDATWKQGLSDKLDTTYMRRETIQVELIGIHSELTEIKEHLGKLIYDR